MSLITRAGDLVYTFRFLKLLVTDFEDTDAFKRGIIDATGKRVKTKKIETSDDKAAYTAFHRLVFNIKKLLAKAPGGQSKMASYAAALFLLKEHYNLSDKNIDKILKESGVEVLDIMEESSHWFLLENKCLTPGVYKIYNEKVDRKHLGDIVNANDKIRVSQDCYPIGSMLGLDIYEVTHITSGQPILVTISELYH